MKKALLLSLILGLAAAMPAQTAKMTIPLRFDHYYTLDQVYEAARALTQAYPRSPEAREAKRLLKEGGR